MLLFVFVVAVINLAVGYALGAGIKPPSITGFLPQREERPVIADIDDDAPLSRAAPIPTPAPAVQGPSTAKAKPSASDVLASLTAVREKLTTASVELDGNRENPEKFEESATKLQAANHEYLDGAGEVIKHLEELGAAGDAAATATRNAVSNGATKFAAISGEIDGIIESGLSSAESRQKLVERSQTLSGVAVEVEKSATHSASPEKSAPDPLELKGTNAGEVDRLFDDLETLLREAEDDAVSHVAVFRIDTATGADQDAARTAALEASVGAIAKELLAEGQTFVPGAPAFMLLEGDTYDEALQRVERLRQQVEATTFSFGEEEVQVTVTCAFADAHKGDSRELVMEQLDEALSESGRIGCNKTFHHDGAFPTETPRAKVAVEPRTVALV